MTEIRDSRFLAIAMVSAEEYRMEVGLDGKEFFAVLENSEKNELVGNLIAAQGEGLGLSDVYCSGLVYFDRALTLSVLTEEVQVIALEIKKRSWQPDRVVVEYEGAGVRVTETKAAVGDTLFTVVEFHNTRDADTRLSLVADGCAMYSWLGQPPEWERYPARMDGRVAPAWPGFHFTTADGYDIALGSSLSPRRARVYSVPPEKIERKLRFESALISERYFYRYTPPDAPTLANLSAASQPELVRSRYLAFDAVYDLDLAPGETRRIVFAMAFSRQAHEQIARALREPDALLAQSTRRWQAFAAALPTFDCDNPKLRRAFYFAWYVLKSNWVELTDHPTFPHPFTAVNKFHYFNQFFWDSAFQAIAWLWCNDARYAREEMANFVHNQWRSGLMPYELFLWDNAGRDWSSSNYRTTILTQPPVIGWTLLEIYRKTLDQDWLRAFYPALCRYEEWLWRDRDGDRDGLACTTNIWESGCDNSPRWDTVVRRVKRGRELDPWAESVDFNTFIYVLRRNLVAMAKILGEKIPTRVARRANRTRQAFQKIFWDNQDGFFYDVLEPGHLSLRVKTHAGLLALLGDLATPRQAGRLIKEHLMNPKEFLVACPCPDVALSEPTFKSFDYWRGSNFPCMTWAVLEATASHDRKAASQVLQRFLATTTSKMQCGEYYDSLSGEQVGMKHQGWGAVVIDMICRRVCGLAPDEANIVLDPLDIGLQWFRLENVSYHGKRVDVRWSQEDGYTVSVDGKRVAQRKSLKPILVATRARAK
jgi:glycogen debranching enzyme